METQPIRPPVHISVSTELIDDYWQAASPSFSEQLSTRMAILERTDGDRVFSEFATIDDDGRNLHLYEWDEESNSGWSTQVVPAAFRTPLGASGQVLVALDAIQDDVGQSLIYHYHYSVFDSPLRGSISVLNRTTQGAFAPGLADTQEFLFDVPADQSVVYQQPGEPVLVCASTALVDSSGEATVLVTILGRGDDGSWVESRQIEDGSITSVTTTISERPQYRIMSIASDNTPVLLRLHEGVAAWRVGDTDPWTAIAGLPALTGVSIRDVHVLDTGGTSEAFVVVAGAGDLYEVAEWRTPEPTVTRLTGGEGAPTTVEQLAVGRSLVDDGLRLFALESDTDALWLLRTDEAVLPAAALATVPWVALGGTFKAISAPPRMVGLNEVYAANFADEIVHKRQDTAAMVWRDTAVKVPLQAGGRPVRTATYSTELTVLDVANAGIGGALVEVSASRRVEATINGVAAHLDPQAPATHATDPFGRLTVVIEAEAMDTARLTAHVAGLMTAGDALTIDPANTARQRLAGQDPDFPVTGATLKDQRLVDPATPDGQADRIAAAVTTVGGLSTTVKPSDRVDVLAGWLLPGAPTTGLRYTASLGAAFSTPLDLSAVKGPGVEIDFTGFAPDVRTLTVDEARSALGSEAPAGDGASPGSLLGDAIHFFRHEADQLRKFVISIEDDEIRIALNDATHVVQAAEHAAALLDVIWIRIKDVARTALEAIEAVLTWLKKLFGFEDILNTAKVVSHAVTRGLVHLEASVTVVQDHVRRDFSTLMDNINNAIDSQEDAFTESFDAAAARGNGGMPVDWQAMGGLHRRHGVQANYMMRHVAAATPSVEAAVSVDRGSDDLADEVVGAFTSNFDVEALEASFDGIKTWSEDALADNSSFYDESLRTILEAAKDAIDLVLDGIEGFLTAFLEVTEQIIEGIGEALGQPVASPVVSEILGLDELTLLDLYSLAVAVPTTLLLKLTAPDLGPPVPRDQVEAILAQDLPWPIDTGTQEFGRVDEDGFNVVALLNAISGVAVLAVAVGDAAADVAAIGEDEFPTTATGTVFFVEFFTQGLAIPTGVVKERADVAVLVLWAVQFIPTFFDGFFVLFHRSRALARFQPGFGPVADSVFGVFDLLVASWQSFEILLGTKRYGVFTFIDGAVTPLPLMAKFLIPLTKIARDGGREGVAAALTATLATADIVGDGTVAFVRTYGAIDTLRST